MIKINGENFYRKKDILNQDEVKAILEDVSYELENNLCTKVPPYQTYADLFPKYSHQPHWQKLFKEVSSVIEETGIKNLALHKSWANLSKEDNRFVFHTHNVDLTCIYYLKNKYSEYGTKLENNIIVEAIQNSIVAFRGGILHSVANMPPEIAKNNQRYSVVFNFRKL
tara:strand:- start:763 stop:1266 length:504 start_codon:yes stop_codon:yes gene_type:complete